MFLKKIFPDEAVSVFFLSESGAKNCHFVSLRLRSVKGRRGGRCSGVAGWRAAVFVSRRQDAARQFLVQKQAFVLELHSPFAIFAYGKNRSKERRRLCLHIRS